MRYDPAAHHRRSLRLSFYDYSQVGAYFVTVCTWNRELLLESKAVRDAVQVAWEGLPSRFPDVALDDFVVMPNHVHVLLTPRVPLEKITRVLKGYSAREANRILERVGRRFWQTESYDHWIRS